MFYAIGPWFDKIYDPENCMGIMGEIKVARWNFLPFSPTVQSYRIKLTAKTVDEDHASCKR